jgi:hypothetical protein
LSLPFFILNILLGKQVRDEQALLFSTELQEENSVNKTEQFSFVAEVPIVQMHEEAVEMEITQDTQENINIGNEQNGNLLDQVEETPSPSVSASKILMPKRKRYNKSRPVRQNAMQYLSEKNDRELQLKLKELELQERKVRLQEKRLEFEIEEPRPSK